MFLLSVCKVTNSFEKVNSRVKKILIENIRAARKSD